MVPGLAKRAALAFPVALAVLSRPASAAADAHELGAELGVWTVLPFVATLLAIAVLPLAAAHWWEHNRNKAKVAAALAVPVAAYLVIVHGATGAHVLLEKGMEYASFIVLLLSLFVITGGVYIRGSLSGTPWGTTRQTLVCPDGTGAMPMYRPRRTCISPKLVTPVTPSM